MKRFINKRNVLIVLALVFFFVAWNRDISILYSLFALLVSTLVLSFLLPRFSLSGVDGGRTLQPTAFENDEITIGIDLSNSGWRNRYMIEVIDSFPAAGPGSRAPMTFIAILKRQQRRRYSFDIACYKRGDYRIGPLTLKSSYPLGISSVSREVPETEARLLVYPSVFNISYLPLRARGHMPVMGIEAVSRAGGSEEFFGTREYRQGDGMRYIHWPSTARHGQYIVKEFEIRAATEVTIILDLDKNAEIGEGRHTPLEYAVKIAASVAKHVLERGHALQLIGFGERPHIVPYGKGPHQLARVLEELAMVYADGAVPYYRAIYNASDYLRDGGTAVLFFTHPDGGIGEYLYSLGLLGAKRMGLLSVFIDRESFGKKEGDGPQAMSNTLAQEVMGMGDPVYFVSKGDDLQEVFSR